MSEGWRLGWGTKGKTEAGRGLDGERRSKSDGASDSLLHLGSRLTASSTVRNFRMVWTGPKISSLAILMSSVASENTVGSM